MPQVQILLTLLVTALMLHGSRADAASDNDVSQNLDKVYEKNITLIDPNNPDQPLGYYLHFGEYTKTVNRTKLIPSDSTAPQTEIPVREFHFNLYLKVQNLAQNTKVTFGVQFRPEWSSKLDQAQSGGRLLQSSSADVETYKRLMPLKEQNTYWDGFVWQFTYDQTSTSDAKMTVTDTWSTKQVNVTAGKLANIELDVKPTDSDKKVQNWWLNLAKTEVTCDGADCLIRGHAKREFFSNDRQDWDLWPGWYELYNIVGFYQFEPVANPSGVQAYVGPTMMMMLSATQLLIGTGFAFGAFAQLI